MPTKSKKNRERAGEPRRHAALDRGQCSGAGVADR